MLAKLSNIKRLLFLIFVCGVMSSLPVCASNAHVEDHYFISNDAFIEHVSGKINKRLKELVPGDFRDDMRLIDLLEEVLTEKELEHFLRVAPGTFIGQGIREILANFVASQTDEILNIIVTTEVQIDTVQSHLDVIDSKVDLILAASADEVFTIDSKIDIILPKVCTIESALDNLSCNSDVSFTIDSKVDIMLPKVCTIESALDNLSCNSDVSFTIDSKVDLILYDFTETWTILQGIEDKVTCITGNTITQEDVGTAGFTITSAGQYSVCENIVFSPSVSANAITVDADNVHLHLNGYTISQGNATASVSGIVVNTGHSGIIVDNGAVTGMTAYGLSAETVNDFVIKNAAFTDNTSGGVLINASNRVCLFETLANNNGGNGVSITGSSSQYQIDSCKTFGNTTHGFNLANLSNATIQNCVAIGNTNDGIVLTDCSDVVVCSNTVSQNGSNGIELAGSGGNTLECYVSNNKLVRNGGVNLIEDSVSGLNSILGNFAQNPSMARNYCEGMSAITTVTIRQSVPFVASPTPWDNINMIP